MDAFLIEDNYLLKNIILFGINSAPTLKRNLIENVSTKKKFKNQNKISW